MCGAAFEGVRAAFQLFVLYIKCFHFHLIYCQLFQRCLIVCVVRGARVFLNVLRVPYIKKVGNLWHKSMIFTGHN